uniref:V2 n=1 Tax=Haemonchus contortus TaxID=6289 RepID=A0A7I4YPV1_HAECO
YIFTRCMIDIGTLRKPLRQWELDEVIEFLKGIITDYEKEVFLHNNLTGSRLMDFCCMHLLVYVLRISESSAAKVMSVLRPYLDEIEDTHNITRREYCFVLRRRHKKSTRDKKSRRRLGEDQSLENVPNKEIREKEGCNKENKVT